MSFFSCFQVSNKQLVSMVLLITPAESLMIQNRTTTKSVTKKCNPRLILIYIPQYNTKMFLCSYEKQSEFS